MKVRKRTIAREIALQLLYQHDIWERADESDGLEEKPDAEAHICSATDDPEVRDFARKLHDGSIDAIEASDRLILDVVDNWTPKRVAVIDRAILRLAVFELGELPEIPPKVTINEAIELAKKYSTRESGAFVNGVLDRLLFLHDGARSQKREDRGDGED